VELFQEAIKGFKGWVPLADHARSEACKKLLSSTLARAEGGEVRVLVRGFREVTIPKALISLGDPRAIKGVIYDVMLDQNNGSDVKKEVGMLALCMIEALTSLVSDSNGKKARNELRELVEFRKPSLSKAIAKYIASRIMVEYTALTDALTDTLYLYDPWSKRWYAGSEAEALVKRIALSYAETELSEFNSLRISSVANKEVANEVLGLLKILSYKVHEEVENLMDEGKVWIGFECGYINIRRWFREGVLEIRDRPRGIALHVLPQRCFDVNSFLAAVKANPSLETVEYLAEMLAPTVVEAMREWVPNPVGRLRLWQAMAYTLLPEAIKKIFLLVGPPNTGKSTFLNMLSAALGRRNVSNVSLEQLLGPRSEYYVAELHGKLANLADEGVQSGVSERFFRSVEVLKALTGGSAVAARVIYSKPFAFVSYAKLFFAVNSPEVVDALSRDVGIRRRLSVFNFTRVFDDSEPPQRLFKEARNLLPALLAALRTVSPEGDLDKKIIELAEKFGKKRGDGIFLPSKVLSMHLGLSAKEVARMYGFKVATVRGVRGIVIKWGDSQGPQGAP
jgi:hypothetical protein